MKVFESIPEYLAYKKLRKEPLAFVPTMGALHAGHMALIEEAKKHTPLVCVSIFVNPTQFNQKSDLEKYPRMLEKDLALLQFYGVKEVLLPRYEELYPDGYEVKITENKDSKILCGASRPGHFDGVLSVVNKLFQIVSPQYAVFGKKDFQQFFLIQKMVKAYFLPIEIIGLETIREDSGLAMSSRNLRLNEEELKIAPQLYMNLKKNLPIEHIKGNLANLGFRVDYLEEWQGRRLVAAFLGEVRLIDNVEIPHE